MSRHRGQSLSDEARRYQNQPVVTHRTRPIEPPPTYHPTSNAQYRQPFEFQAAEEYYHRGENRHKGQESSTYRQEVHQSSAPSDNVLRSLRMNDARYVNQALDSAHRGHLGGNRKAPPEPILTGRMHKPEALPRRSARNMDRPRPNYVNTSKAQRHGVSPIASPSTIRPGNRSEAKKLAEKTLRGMQMPENVQVSQARRANAVSADRRAQLDKASMSRMAIATRLFHENPRAKPYFHNVWHETTNSHGQIERRAEKVLFFGHLDNFDDVSAVISPDRRYFLLKQEEIDQQAHIAPISWAGFSADPRLRTNGAWGAINHSAAMQMIIKESTENGARITKHGRTLRLLERRDELDALTPDEREKVFNTLRKDMPITPVTPVQESKGHDGGSGFFHRSSKRDKKQKQLAEKWERGMLSNEEVLKLQAKGTLPQHQRSRQERRMQGPVTALYDYDWEADLYPNSRVEKSKPRKKWFERN